MSTTLRGEGPPSMVRPYGEQEPAWIPAYGRWHRLRRARRADLLEAAAVGSVLVVVVAFLARGGAAHLTSTGADLVAAGQLVGLVAADLLLIQLLLSARLPLVDRVYGIDRGLKAHRVLGRVTVPMLVVHAAALTAGYAAQDGLSARTAWVVEPLRMLRDLPHLVLAGLSLALFIVIAVTSVRAARRRMGYERWHLVHLTAYAAVVLSVPHQLSDGSDLIGHPLVRAYWLALYVATAGAVLWWRALVPFARSVWHALYVERVVQEAPGVYSVWVRGRRLDRLDAQAGQFFNWRFLSRGLFLAAHPWSLSAQPGGRRLRITVRELGDHSARLSRLRPGTRVLVEGPYGRFTTERRQRRRVALVAAGIGITPVRALAEELCTGPGAVPQDVTVLYRADTADQLALGRELQDLADRTGMALHLLVGPPVRGSWLPEPLSEGRADAAAVAALVPNVHLHDVYVCGPAAWMDLVHGSLADAGVPKEHVHDERFAW